MSVLFDVRNICFSYPSLDHKVLNDVSLKISEGEVLSLIGRNGAGKSTLLSCLLGLKKPKSGEIYLCGKSLHGMKEREIASLVGFVPQQHVPAFGHTVFDFVQMGCASRISLLSHPGKKDEAATRLAMQETGIAHLADRPYTELSGGEMQQAIIARAIVTRPRIVLFDEPTAHLDFGNQLRVLKMIKNLADNGLSVLITTHDPNQALLLDGSSAILNTDGRLVSGKTKDLITEETLKNVYDSELRLQYIEDLERNVCIYPSI